MGKTASLFLALSAYLSTFVCSFEAQAAQSNIGTSAAQTCYQAATYGPSVADLATCTRAIEEEDMTRMNLAATYSNRGILWSARGRYDRALEDQNTSIGLNPDSARAYINRANVQFRMKQYDAALADYDKAVSLLEDKFPVVYYNRSLANAAAGKRAAAIADMEHALKLAPGSTEYQDALNQLK